MNEDFVSFDLAKKLKEKGYPQTEKNTLAMYNKDGEWYSLSPTLDDFYYDFIDFDENDCVSPTISQVLKWMREEKGINVNMRLFVENGWYFTIQNYKGEPIHSQLTDTDDLYLSYEQAANEGIEYALDNVI